MNTIASGDQSDAAKCPSCGKRLASDDSRRNRRYLWGLALAGLLFLPLPVGLINALRGAAIEKATGLGAVAGGIAEIFVTFGAGAAFLLPMIAILLLSSGLSKTHPARTFFAAVSIGWCVLFLLLLAITLWLVFFHHPIPAT